MMVALLVLAKWDKFSSFGRLVRSRLLRIPTSTPVSSLSYAVGNAGDSFGFDDGDVELKSWTTTTPGPFPRR
jgi:hypothetical protein